MKKSVLTLVILIFSMLNVNAADSDKMSSRIAVFGGAGYVEPISKIAPSFRAAYTLNYKGLNIGLMSSFHLAETFEIGFHFPIYFNPYERLVVWGGPGILVASSLSYNTPESDDAIFDKTQQTGNLTFSFGAGWEFDLSEKEPDMHITPMLVIDFMNITHPYISLGVNVDLQFLY